MPIKQQIAASHNLKSFLPL